MAEERASNSSTLTDESTATDKTQPSPGISGIVAMAGTGSGVLPPQSRLLVLGLSGGVFNPRNPPPVTQYHAQGWHFPPSQGGNYGYSNNPQPLFDPFGIGVGGYNPPIFGTFPRPSMNNPPYNGPIYSTTPVIQPMPNPQPSQAAVSIPQAASNGANRPIFPEMSRQMLLETSHANNTVESLVVFRQQIEESHHDLVNMLTQQMATVLTP
ncbi:hypothetical protein PIB30_057328 [Stylosanthes scabra]|uniref:Uncharacterized protein n=1 Tax=Stylosanthes scabra TaxID=79078 RepID=A0ABU6SJL4_9FABA|nr:hypothetical protein [Stylosanthes scabra]